MTCPKCGGRKTATERVPIYFVPGFGWTNFRIVPCPECKGTGEMPQGTEKEQGRDRENI